MVRHLLQRRLAVRALVQNPHSARAKALADQGIEIAQGDMDDLASLKRAMAGVRGVYSVQDYFTVGAAREVQEGKNMAGAALDAGVEHFVFSSVGGAERNSGIHHFETKWEIENHIRKLGLPATMIRPAGFMENYYIPPLERQLLKGRLLDPIRAGKPLQTIASDDIGKFISLAFAQPDRFIGLELEIAGSELTRPDTAEVFSRVLGRRVKAYHLPLPLVRLSMGKEWYQMFAWLNKNGFQADIPALRRDYPDVPLTSLEEWLRREGWAGRREITVKRDSMGRPASAALPVSAGGPSRRAPKEASCPIAALPRLDSFRDSVNRVTMNGCDLRYLRTGSGRSLGCSTRARAQLGYFAPLLRHLNTARFAVIAPTCPGTASRERPARTTRPPTSPTP